MIKIEPPHITASKPQEQIQQVIHYLRRLTEQLNMEINGELDDLRENRKE